MNLAALGLAALTVAVSIPAQAGSVNGHVLAIYVRQSDGLVYFETDGTISNRAACAASNNLWVLPNENSETSKRQYAALLAAKASNVSIDVFGSGLCGRWGDSEDVDTIVVRN